MRVDMGPHDVSAALREWTLSGAFCPYGCSGSSRPMGIRMKALVHDLREWHGGKDIGWGADRLSAHIFPQEWKPARDYPTQRDGTISMSRFQPAPQHG